MTVTNLVKDQSDALKAANETLIDEEDPSKFTVNLRIGFRSGSAVAVDNHATTTADESTIATTMARQTNTAMKTPPKISMATNVKSCANKSLSDTKDGQN